MSNSSISCRQRLFIALATAALGVPATVVLAEPTTPAISVPTGTIVSPAIQVLRSRSNRQQVATPPFPQQPSEAPPPPPQNPPTGRNQAGGGLGSETSCGTTEQILTALVPEANPAFTALAHPTVLFNFPDSPEDIDYAEFILLSADDKEQVYEAEFVPERPGIISVSIPTEDAYALTSGKVYHWYLNVYCQNLPKPVAVNGWVQRASSMSEVAMLEAAMPLAASAQAQPANQPATAPSAKQPTVSALPIFWYDAIAAAAAQLTDHQQPNPQTQAQWTQWLTAIGLSDIVNVPIVGPVQLRDADSAQADSRSQAAHVAGR